MGRCTRIIQAPEPEHGIDIYVEEENNCWVFRGEATIGTRAVYAKWPELAEADDRRPRKGQIATSLNFQDDVQDYVRASSHLGVYVCATVLQLKFTTRAASTDHQIPTNTPLTSVKYV
jgi:hypothetical protein